MSGLRMLPLSSIVLLENLVNAIIGDPLISAQYAGTCEGSVG